MQTAIDHLVVAGASLDAAGDHLDRSLGLRSQQGGKHAGMGTHNRLLSLGPETYAEALAIEPGAPAPEHPRWFGLDAGEGDPEMPPRLAAWALRVDDLGDALAHAPEGIGQPLAMQRGDFNWRITVPDSGTQPFDGLFPALIAWAGPIPPAVLPDSGARLLSLTLTHPDAGRLGWALSMLCDDNRVTVRSGPPALTALIHTVSGEKVLT